MNWRRLRRGELDHELLWLSVSLLVIPIAWLWLRCDLPLPQCPFHCISGIPCPTCGMTRCVRYLFAGSLIEAGRINPLGVCVAAGLALFDFYAFAVIILRLPRLRFERMTRWSGILVRAACGSALLLNWVWLIRTRMCG